MDILRFFVFLLILMGGSLQAQPAKERFFLSGDGTLRIVNAKNGFGGKFTYRDADGDYLKEGIQGVNHVFGVDKNDEMTIDLRLISLLDYLQDHFKGGKIRVISGYRSSEYNEGLRQKGALAAKTSLHLEGMAADIEIEGVSGKKIWQFVRSLNCCGAGFYHGKGIHVDTGPSRFWDEKTTKVEKDLGSHNRLLLLRTEFDRYRPGEVVKMGIYRITDYPFGVRQKGVSKCLSVDKKENARKLEWKIPEEGKGESVITWEICQKNFPEMPDELVSNMILISKD